MAGAREVLRFRFGIDGRKDSDGAIGGANSRSDADARVHRFRESSAVNGSVDWRHEREVELIAALLGERKANQAAAMLGHEIDSVGRDFFGGHGEVAFVFAVLIVNEDDHVSLADIFDGFFDGGEHFRFFSHGKKDRSNEARM